MNLNKILLCGNVCKQPEIRYTSSSTAVCTFTLATNKSFKRNGEKVQETQFHNIKAFGKIAETCNEYLVKGQEAFIEGEIDYESWEKDGQKHYRTTIKADRVNFGRKPQAKEATAEIEPELDNSGQEIPF